MARAFSLMLAAASVLGLLFLPAMRGGALTSFEHGLLMPMLLVVSGLFIHAVGYVPENRWLRRILRPVWLWTTWALLVLAWKFAA